VFTGEPELAPAAPTPPPTPRGPPRPSASLVAAFSLPPAPPIPCAPNPALRVASSDQADLGDESAITGDFASALDHWRAAVTINACNGVAWTSIGNTLLDGGTADKAETALAIATQLTPANVFAWTQLGRAREQLGKFSSAVTAYQTALGVQSDFKPALDGLDRARRAGF
jgi:Flp pilus assembly protein TadD